MTAEEALQAMMDPHVEAVDAWERTLYPSADPLAAAHARDARKTMIAELRKAAAFERELAEADATAKRQAHAQALEAERVSVAAWSERLFGKAKV